MKKIRNLLSVLLLLICVITTNATTYTTTSDGNWDDPIWSPDLSTLSDGDVIIIDNYVTLSGTHDYSSLNLTVIINGTLYLGNPSLLKLGSGSQVDINGDIDANGMGNNDKIKIGSTVYSEDDLIGFEPGTILTEDGPLPVELIYFKALLKTNSVLLKWSTATEQNNDYFTIEKSTDGNHWFTITYVNGSGTITTPVEYKYEDFDMSGGHNVYYRLFQTDYDGISKQLSIININTSFKRYSIFNIKDTEIVESFQIYDLNGNVVTENYQGIKIFILKTDKDIYVKKIL